MKTVKQLRHNLVHEEPEKTVHDDALNNRILNIVPITQLTPIRLC